MTKVQIDTNTFFHFHIKYSDIMNTCKIIGACNTSPRLLYTMSMINDKVLMSKFLIIQYSIASLFSLQNIYIRPTKNSQAKH